MFDTHFSKRYDELDWRVAADEREAAELARDQCDMEELLMESTPRETEGELQRTSVYLEKSGWCDGSGFFEEVISEDQTRAVRCDGCPACEEEQKTWALIMEDSAGGVAPFVPEVDARPVHVPEVDRKPVSVPVKKLAPGKVA